CLPSEEAPRMAHVQFTDVQERPTEFLDLTSLTRDEFQQLLPPFEAEFKRLHPLFELEMYLAAQPIQPENLILQDKIIGKPAALLIHRLGFRTVKAGLLSRRGEAVSQRHGIAYTSEQLVD